MATLSELMIKSRDLDHVWRYPDSVCSLTQPKSDLSDFGQLKVPNSGKPEFGGRGNPASLRRVWSAKAKRHESRPLAIASLIPSPLAWRVLGPILSHSWLLRLRHGRPSGHPRAPRRNARAPIARR